MLKSQHVFLLKIIKMDFEANYEQKSILSLPDVPLLRILEFIPAEEYKQLMFVCRKFYELLQLYKFSRHSPLTIQNCCLSPNEEPWSFLINTSRIFPSIIVYPNQNKDSQNSDEFWRKIGEKTIELELRSFSFRVTNDFLNFFPNLIKLYLFDLDTLNDIVLPQNIQELYFRKAYFGQEVDAAKYKNITRLTTQTFVECKPKEEKFPEKKLQTITKPIVGLKQRVIQFNGIIAHEGNISLTYFRSLDIYRKFWFVHTLTIIKFPQNGCFFIHKKVNCEPLRHFSFNMKYLEEPVAFCNQCTKFFAKSCPNITILSLNDSRSHSLLKLIHLVAKNNKLKTLEYMAQFKVQMVDVVFPTLTQLFLSGPIELNGLQPCLSIKDLTFINKFNHYDIDLLTRNFPNVTRATFGNMNFNEKHTESISKYWKKLKTINVFRGFERRKLTLPSGPEIKSFAFQHIPSLLRFNNTCRCMIQTTSE